MYDRTSAARCYTCTEDDARHHAAEVVTEATTDPIGRTCVIVPDDVADELVRYRRSTWTELHGLATGYTRPAYPGTRIGALLAAIHAACLDAGDARAFVGNRAGIAEVGTYPTERNSDAVLISTCGIGHNHAGAFQISG